MKSPIRSAHWLSRIGLVLTSLFFFYCLIAFPETSLSDLPQRLSDAAAQHPTQDALKQEVAHATRIMGYTDSARISLLGMTVLYTLVTLVFWILCSRKIGRVRRELQCGSDRLHEP